MKKSLTWMGVGAAVALMAALVVRSWLFGGGSAPSLLSSIAPKTTVNENVTLSVLHSEAMSFLVTRRATTQIVVEHQESNIFGDWHGVLWANVSWVWGVNLKKIEKKDLRREGDVIVVHLSEPELLNFGVEPASVKFMSKSTAWPKLQSVFGDLDQRNKLEEGLKDAALKFAADKNLMPTRREIVQQLNDATAVLKQAGATDIRFE